MQAKVFNSCRYSRSKHRFAPRKHRGSQPRLHTHFNNSGFGRALLVRCEHADVQLQILVDPLAVLPNILISVYRRKPQRLPLEHHGLPQVPLASGGMGVTRHPDGTHNTFFTMAKVIGEQRIHFFMLPGHTAKNVQAWAERGEHCPMALVIGCHPAYEIGAAYTGPHPGFSELNLISTILGAPVPTTRAETLDLDIPALAEIVVEGFIDAEKAPYIHASSHSDSYAPIVSMEPFFDVTAITMREKPIYRHLQPTRFTEHHSLAEFITIPPLFTMLQAKGLPVKDIHMPLRSCGNCAFIQMTANNPLEVREVMQTAMANPMSPRLRS